MIDRHHGHLRVLVLGAIILGMAAYAAAQEYPPALCRAFAEIVLKDLTTCPLESAMIRGPKGQCREPPGLERAEVGETERHTKGGA